MASNFSDAPNLNRNSTYQWMRLQGPHVTLRRARITQLPNKTDLWVDRLSAACAHINEQRAPCDSPMRRLWLAPVRPSFS
jgi:hypothetical protein